MFWPSFDPASTYISDIRKTHVQNQEILNELYQLQRQRSYILKITDFMDTWQSSKCQTLWAILGALFVLGVVMDEYRKWDGIRRKLVKEFEEEIKVDEEESQDEGEDSVLGDAIGDQELQRRIKEEAGEMGEDGSDSEGIGDEELQNKRGCW
ncbi:uncharacterized protein PAC_15381 [Phialocephala subalpina]|uniref:Uncharacterized protein n=1 Tax=Phialocephala subalpina TaxID=576137 RepID=A0A1L7XK98_9HELO|nr:uncharacterized protein PAC_15381 [Phialocephala subalpina]